MTNNPENAELCGAQSSSPDRQISQAPTSAQPALISWLLQLASQPKPVVVGFYREGDQERWPRSHVEELLREVAPEYVGKCLFVAATFPEEDLLREYNSREDLIKDWPWYAVFVYGSIVASDKGDTINSEQIRELADKGSEFRKRLLDNVNTPIAWVVEDDWPPRIHFDLEMDTGRDKIIPYINGTGSDKAFATSSLPVFLQQIEATARQCPVSGGIVIIYAPVECNFWKNVGGSPLDTSTGIILPCCEHDAHVITAEQFQPLSWLKTPDTTSQPKFITSEAAKDQFTSRASEHVREDVYEVRGVTLVPIEGKPVTAEEDYSEDSKP